jgi:hypothetical protein
MIAANVVLAIQAVSLFARRTFLTSEASRRIRWRDIAFGWIVVCFVSPSFSNVAQADSKSSVEQLDTAVDNEANEIRASDEVWEISTRHLPQSSSVADLENPKFRVSRWSPNDGWIVSSIEQYLASVRGLEGNEVDNNPSEAQLHNIVYVHGNWMPADLTRDRGLLIYRYLAQRAQTPLRITIFSWPSQREGIALLDVKENATVAEMQGLYLGSLLQKFPAQKQLGIIGFSYGARAVTGSLHAMSGGYLCGRSLAKVAYPSQVRISLMAAAIDRQWLLDGQRHGEALKAVHSIVNLYNSQDPVLRRYHLISKTDRARAAGFAGLALPRNWSVASPTDSTVEQDELLTQLRQYDCRGQLGRSHDERSYYRECSCTPYLLDHVLWNDRITVHAATDVSSTTHDNP